MQKEADMRGGGTRQNFLPGSTLSRNEDDHSPMQPFVTLPHDPAI
jgi:hypothetical protein